MKRRTVLLTSGAAVSTIVAGCAGEDDDGGDPDSDADDANGDETAPHDETNETQLDDESAETGEDVAETIDGAIGERIAGDNLHLVVEDVTRTTELGEFFTADLGSEFAVVSLAMKNVADEFLTVSNVLQTTLRDDSGETYQQSFLGGDENTFDDGQFAPGEVERGQITFEIPDTAGGLELQFDFDVTVFGGIDRALIDLEQAHETVHLRQDLGIDVHAIGDSVTDDDVAVTVDDVDYRDRLGTFAQPDAGNEYAIVDLTVTNDTGSEQRISTMLQMLVKDGDGYSYQEDWSAATELERNFDESKPLADGETRSGRVAYEVPQDESPLYWVFEFDLWTDGDKTFWRLR